MCQRLNGISVSVKPCRRPRCFDVYSSVKPLMSITALFLLEATAFKGRRVHNSRQPKASTGHIYPARPKRARRVGFAAGSASERFGRSLFAADRHPRPKGVLHGHKSARSAVVRFWRLTAIRDAEVTKVSQPPPSSRACRDAVLQAVMQAFWGQHFVANMSRRDSNDGRRHLKK